ncbi:NAD-dependent protein deacetylase [Massilia glaciei]|uniref:protein acetyllysine N-acetyltransferase n=1 Tax=Massilia glaciei TaxID=1524097 RepID=A0A2U2HJE1_9BURK|nr:NAD-dependent protein deacetylase [Massilia glaciei]PWF47671.1 NAD-dependent protein deacetylase [Massilia glaciei]
MLDRSDGIDGVQRLAAFLGRHRQVLVLTGAGLSTASGIPDYRDRDGARRGAAPIQGPDFRRHAAVRKRYWARSMVGWPLLEQARPNAGHHALAELESDGAIASLITQNVDGLHQRAGSVSLTELHGNIHAVVCLDCHAQFPRAFVQTQLERANPAPAGTGALPAPDGDAQLEPGALDDFNVPDCIYCAGTLKPDVVFFGDGVPADRTARALAQIERADALLVVGSSLAVFSGFRFCRMAAASGKPIAAVNLGWTRADDLLELKLAAGAEDVLPMLARVMRAH